MFVIIGIVVVLGAVVAGYIMDHGNIAVLIQPAEILILGGAGFGSFLAATALCVAIDEYRTRHLGDPFYRFLIWNLCVLATLRCGFVSIIHASTTRGNIAWKTMLTNP